MKVGNPIMGVDMPDMDVIRVGNTYYMVSTTMFYMPGAPILKSKDLCNWEIVSYIFDVLEDNERYRLENGKNAYGRGQWATSLVYHDGNYFACFVSHDSGKTYIFSTDDIEKSNWVRREIGEVFHDMSFLFWKDTPYLVYGCGDIRIVELERDLSGVKAGGINRLLFKTEESGMRLRCEGCRALVKNGYIYLLFIDWPKERGRREVCYRSADLEGPYEFRILMDDQVGFPNREGTAQGVLIDTADGDWYAMLFQNRGASGRIPMLISASWQDDWPILGEEKGYPARYFPKNIELPFEKYNAKPLTINDDFCYDNNKLALQWQWNHNPINSCWSFTEYPGWLRLTTGQLAQDLMQARNTLTQRTLEPGCVCEVALDVSGIKDGDYAGLCALQTRYGQIGVTARNDEKFILVIYKRTDGALVETLEPLKNCVLSLRILFEFENMKDQATFYYRYGEEEWTKIGGTLDMLYTLDFFVGYRIGIFNYATKAIGGHADFKDFVIRGLES